MRTLRFRLALPAALAAAGSLAATSTAIAATEVASRVDLLQQPRLFGPGLAYVEGGGPDGRVVLRSAAPGKPGIKLASGFVRDVNCTDEECDSDDFLFDADGTPGRVAFSKAQTFVRSGAPRRFSLFTGGVAGPFPQLFSCTKASDIGIYGYSIDGDAIAYGADSCVDGLPGTRVTVRDFGAGATGPKSYPLAADAGFVLAGRYLATATPAALDDKVTLKVVDWTTGSMLYTATIPDRVFALDAQADGKVVVGTPRDLGEDKGPPLPGRTRPTRCHVALAWLSAAEPTPHKLSTCGDGALQIEGDRILFARSDSKTTQIAQSDLAGKLTTVLSVKPAGVLPSLGSRIGDERFDVDGSRIAYGISRCLGESLYVQDLPVPAAKDETVSCPTSFTAARVKVSKSGTVKLPLSCPKGCTGDLTLYKILTDGSNGVDFVAGSIPSVTIAAGSKKLKVKLSSKARAAIKTKGKLAVRAQLFHPPFGTERTLVLVK